MAIKRCENDCRSEFQDKTYGKGMRVMNKCKLGTSLRCTVCDKEKSVGTAGKKK